MMLSEEKQKEVLDYFSKSLTFISRMCGLYRDEVINIIKSKLNEITED